MIRRFWSSIVIRQALVSTITMLAVIALIALAARIAVQQQQQRALLAVIDTDIAGLTDGMMAGGAAEVARRIADRTTLADVTGARYRLTDARGVRLAGTLIASPLDATRSQTGEIATADGPALARATRLRGDYDLIVARSLAPTQALVARLMRLFALSAIPGALLSVTVGMVLARRLGRGVVRLSETFGRFHAGDHAARTALADGLDELATLARHVDRHLAQTDTLIEAQRQHQREYRARAAHAARPSRHPAAARAGGHPRRRRDRRAAPCARGYPGDRVPVRDVA